MLKKLVAFVFCSALLSFAQVQIESYRLPSGTTNTGLFQSFVVQHIAGITVPVNWADVDDCSTPPNPPVPCTTYNWMAIDAAVTPYTGNIPPLCLSGTEVCVINFEVNAASGGIGIHATNTATPYYVFTSAWASSCCGSSPPVDACFCPNYPGDNPVSSPGCQNTQPPDTTGVPAGWEQPFITAYEGFISAVVARYNSSGAGYKVGYIRWGLGTGGGGVIPCPTQEMAPAPPTSNGPSIPLTLSVWQSYASTIFSFAASTHPTMLMEGSGYGNAADVGIAYADAVASAAAANGAGIGAESLALNDQFLYASGAACSNDWCNIFNTYALQAPMLGLQTIDTSEPSCTSDPGAGKTCSLVFVLPFGTQRHANVFEIANGDLLCAWGGAAYSSTPCPSMTSPYAPYKTAIQNAASGLPNSTSITSGSAVASGTGSVR